MISVLVSKKLSNLLFLFKSNINHGIEYFYCVQINTKSARMVYKSIIVSMIRILCLFGCLFQLYKVTSNFLEFRVRSEVTFDSPKKIEMPAIDFAFPIATLINLTALELHSPNVLSNVCQEFKDNKGGDQQSRCAQALKSPRIMTQKLVNHLKTGDIERFTRDPTKYFTFLNIQSQFDPNLIEKNCSFKRYFNFQNIFVRISCLNGSNPIFIDTKNLLVEDFPFLMMGLTIDGLGSFALRLSPVNSQIIGNMNEFRLINLSSDKFNILRISFKRKITRMLGPPFETNCRDFNKKAALEECVNNKTLQYSHKLFRNIAVPFGRYSEQIGFSLVLSDLTKKLHSECAFKMNFNECQSIDYSLEIEKTIEEQKYGFCFITLEPVTPDLIYISLPAQNWLEFIIFVGSVLGMWFGVSMLSQMMAIMRFCETCTHPTSVHVESSGVS
uniref:Uncharacterized protein n=1 Tax=Tetranychus urticae TaxID=32264 RepID=T1KYM3_TETUR